MYVSRVNVHRQGIAFVEIVCAIAMTMLLAVVMVAQIQDRADRSRSQCLVHLRETGLAFRAFANDNQDRFPAQTAAVQGGALEAAAAGNLPRVYQALGDNSFELRHLVCPDDDRVPPSSLAGLQSSNVSYFVGLDAIDDRPDSVLLGDRHVVRGRSNQMARGLTALNDERGVLVWAPLMHRGNGNVAFADGSAATVGGDQLHARLRAGGCPASRLLFPQ